MAIERCGTAMSGAARSSSKRLVRRLASVAVSTTARARASAVEARPTPMLISVAGTKPGSAKTRAKAPSPGWSKPSAGR